MSLKARMMMGIAAGLVALSVSGTAFAATTVAVSLWDKGEHAMDMFDKMAPMGMGMHGDMMKVTMGITATPDKIKAGEVTFAVTNDSKSLIHEMIVAPVASADTELPYDKDANGVIEEKTGDLGEVSELDPGKSGALTVNLKPGTYVLFCNVPGHYVMGMWTTVVVTQ